MFVALETLGSQSIPTTGSVFGLGQLLRRPIYARYLAALLRLACVRRILFHSIWPESLQALLSERRLLPEARDPCGPVRPPLLRSVLPVEGARPVARGGGAAAGRVTAQVRLRREHGHH